jgi:aspartate/methionine/tyrosine aminotransferase
VALVPGNAFVEAEDPFLRLSYTADTPVLIAGLEIYTKHVWKP